MGVSKVSNSVKTRLGSLKLKRNEQRKYLHFSRQKFSSSAELMNSHFATWSSLDHINFNGFKTVFDLVNEEPQAIIETGTSAWGTDSTRLWDAYVRQFGGEFWSVDLSPLPSRRLEGQVSQQTHLIVDDSVHFLTEFAMSNPDMQVDICYLDSWDLDWSDSEPAALHGLSEWRAIAPLMRKGSILIIDDSPASLEWIPIEHQEKASRFQDTHGFLPGKGALVHQELRKNDRVRITWHGYNVVYLFES